jgi:hypothetical protein
MALVERLGELGTAQGDVKAKVVIARCGMLTSATDDEGVAIAETAEFGLAEDAELPAHEDGAAGGRLPTQSIFKSAGVPEAHTVQDRLQFGAHCVITEPLTNFPGAPGASYLSADGDDQKGYRWSVIQPNQAVGAARSYKLEVDPNSMVKALQRREDLLNEGMFSFEPAMIRLCNSFLSRL